VVTGARVPAGFVKHWTSVYKADSSVANDFFNGGPNGEPSACEVALEQCEWSSDPICEVRSTGPHFHLASWGTHVK
jgi:hypothetical protein